MEQGKLYPTLVGSIEAILIALRLRDPFTWLHSDRVEHLAATLGDACGVAQVERDFLRVGAHFHDIGKIGVPDAVLLKAGQLTSVEWKTMKAHSEQGERIVRATAIPQLEPIALAIRHHHESFDGSGYPDGLAGEAIPLFSRILLVADAYDAMSIVRPYNRARTHVEIMDIMESEVGEKFDPDVFRQFSRQIEHSPARVN